MVSPILLLALCFAVPTLSAYVPDEVIILPGIAHQPSFKHYSGYLQVSSTKFLHYWFVTSQNNPATDPVALWLNGGPGCSSMEGMLTENGPFQVQDDATIKINNYSWNRVANVLYIEAPAGVGYSYATDGNTATNDSQTAIDNHEALIQFFIKFPEFKTNDFFITGESYAGIYVPTLSVLVATDKTFNFKGIAVGNGVHSVAETSNALIYFLVYHGLIDQKLWSELIDACKCVNTSTSLCDFRAAALQYPSCLEKRNAALTSLENLDRYNIYDVCAGGATFIAEKSTNNLKNSFSLKHFLQADSNRSTKWAILKPAMNIDSLKSQSDTEFIEELRKLRAASCTNDTAVNTYMNDPAVREALHITTNLPGFEVCSSTLKYKQIYDTMYNQYQFLIKNTSIRFLIYNGDVDSVCNFLGAQWFFDMLGYQRFVSYRQWNFVSEDGTKQVGGFGKTYNVGSVGQRLTLITVRGSGHMVPHDRPIPAFTFFYKFLANLPILDVQ